MTVPKNILESYHRRLSPLLSLCSWDVFRARWLKNKYKKYSVNSLLRATTGETFSFRRNNDMNHGHKMLAIRSMSHPLPRRGGWGGGGDIPFWRTLPLPFFLFFIFYVGAKRSHFFSTAAFSEVFSRISSALFKYFIWSFGCSCPRSESVG